MSSPSPSPKSSPGKLSPLAKGSSSPQKESVLTTDAPTRQKKAQTAMDMVDKAHIEAMEIIYFEITADFKLNMGRDASKRDRTHPDSPPEVVRNRNLVYSEIEFETIALVIEKIKKFYGVANRGASGYGRLQHRGGVFYDLGCGSGKVLIAATCMHEFDSCWGIETLGSLLVIATDLIRSYQTRGKQQLHRDFDTHCSAVHGDFLQFSKSKNWSNGDVVYANTSSFDTETMERLAELAENMSKGSFFISVSKKLPSSEFTVIDHVMMPVSFGEATIYIQQKTDDD